MLLQSHEMICQVFGTKPLTEPVLTNYQLSSEELSGKSEENIIV